MIKNIIASLFLFLIASVPFAFAAEADSDDILGLWSTPEGRSRIEIFKCGDNYCGRIAELKEPHYPLDDPRGMGGKPKMDRNNPSPDLRTRPLVGLQLMEGFRHKGDHAWEDGKIYDPESGKLYRCKMTLSSPQRLEVRGFIGISLIGRTSTWTR